MVRFSSSKTSDCCPKKGSRSYRIVRFQLNKRQQTDGDGNPELDRSGDPVISAWVSCRPATLFNTPDLKGMNPEAKASLDRLIQEQLDEISDDALHSVLPAQRDMRNLVRFPMKSRNGWGLLI